MQRLRPVGGITPYVDGAGGNELYPVNRRDPRLAFADDSHHGALRMKLRPGRAILTFVGEDGTRLDQSTVGCRQPYRPGRFRRGPNSRWVDALGRTRPRLSG